MPARMTPAATASSAPWLLITSASRTMTVSLCALVPSIGMPPATDTLYPMTPMSMATAMESRAHVEAMRRETLISLSSRMAMKRSRMCGIPK